MQKTAAPGFPGRPQTERWLELRQKRPGRKGALGELRAGSSAEHLRVARNPPPRAFRLRHNGRLAKNSSKGIPCRSDDLINLQITDLLAIGIISGQFRA